ncbi:site-specific DNA-methyltransferase [Dechloromonas sp. XY25]|uniref:site-specific DNA-methyltransferase (cytosine-N(4)-specific) n=1 Tax=Dechloromonas hankyongensis TaxID=2908002 RepID=A0ABS9K4I3_9RHOO|nr:site-specific DNA-methyltransferase [Dechloromonas hankyongensis]MCG2578084.1 site-specific DNA-methyltransferase [Dechloromonas hankyongensis]
MNSLLKHLRYEFATAIAIPSSSIAFDSDYENRCEALVTYLSKYDLLPLPVREKAFFSHVNKKFKINAHYLAAFYERGAKLGKTFNYHQKVAIQEIFDREELFGLSRLLDDFSIDTEVCETLAAAARCSCRNDTLEHLHLELKAPAKLRREVGERDVRTEILKALFASFLWGSLPQRDMHRYFDSDFNEEGYCERFWDELQRRTPRLFHRDSALHYIVIDETWCSHFQDYISLQGAVLRQVRESYVSLNNYGYLAVMIKSALVGRRDHSWELAADVSLFAEKHVEKTLDRGYFRFDKIRSTTVAHIPDLDLGEARFELVNEGFTYRDCFVLERPTGEVNQLLVFQKNLRDETAVPCPTCRSSQIEGNSYPSLGVKSWECCNALCPDRSKYNRGKRYSFRGLTMQQALDDESNDIPATFVRKWRRDVVAIEDDSEVLEHLLRHYSMSGDGVTVLSSRPEVFKATLGRQVSSDPLLTSPSSDDAAWFFNAAFFKRYGVPTKAIEPVTLNNLGNDELNVFCGDSRQVLLSIGEDVIDGAVTSPPYYNAREYSQWPNMYCYLQDMFEVNAQVFRVLKPGAIYYYNIFDYFDNENIVAQSAMGQKRLILSGYTVDLFRKIGFQCLGNIVWDKGEIEGKRGFNAGNFSPFYQSPFNCWEHVLVFQKPGSEPAPSKTGILRAKPVIKMVRGKNVHGHTAPFPEEIPLLCMETTPKNGLILDPFGGSLTTGRVAVAYGRRAICIEQSQDYCDLGLKLYHEGNKIM